MGKQKETYRAIGLTLAIVSLLCVCASTKLSFVVGFIALIFSAKGITDRKHLHKLNAVGLGISIFVIFASLAGISSGVDEQKKSEKVVENATSTEKEYTTDSINIVSSNPNNYKDKYITFDGCNVNIIQEDNDNICYQVFTDLDYSTSVLVEVPKSICADKITSDYVTINGQIQGTKRGQTIVGAHTSWAYIIADSITPSTYIDTFGKADTTWTYTDKIVEQHEVAVQVTQVDFNSTETRIYVTVTNNSTETFNVFSYGAKIIQNGQQYEVTSNYNADYPSLSSELLPNASTSGVICYQTLDQSDFQFQIEGSSDDWNLEFEPFSFDITAQ